jgi:hypothetical protein
MRELVLGVRRGAQKMDAIVAVQALVAVESRRSFSDGSLPSFTNESFEETLQGVATVLKESNN